MFASSKLFAVSALLALFIGLTWAVPVTLPGGVNPGGPNIPVIPSVLPSGNPGLPTIPSLPTGVPQVGEGIYPSPSFPGKVGAGIFVEQGHPLNLSTILEGTNSSTQGEIRAARVALELIRRWPSYSHQHVVLCTDEIYLVKTLRRGPPFVCAYKRDIENLYKAATSFPKGVTVKHVFGHKGNIGNEEADSMARSALNLSRSRHRSPPDTTYPPINEHVHIHPAKNWAELFYGTNSKIEMYDGDDKIF
ncbi:RNase H domain-containing protein [Ditylenchus destructor]|uniref:RNase H domain-containing protein n=1 Tax=Ditylenchus destructor TaxID=166010 RepID=A0AAD4MQ67_9BILA|nr:RNase H domain-containing protein [Ditylenchus destructor]